VVDSRYVYLLWHGDDIYPDTPEAKLLGVYSSEAAARDRIGRSSRVAGFANEPDAFEISRYEIDHDSWVEGYVVVDD
jgi:hypothetical protein